MIKIKEMDCIVVFFLNILYTKKKKKREKKSESIFLFHNVYHRCLESSFLSDFYKEKS
jgi:hypothetical protein